LTIDGATVKFVPVAGGRFSAVKAVFNVCKKVGAALVTAAAIVLAAANDDEATAKVTTTPLCSKWRPLGAAPTEVMVMALAGTLIVPTMAVTNAVCAAWVKVATV
jgi:hypothetical protein